MSNVVINVIPKPITSGSASTGKRSKYCHQVISFILLAIFWSLIEHGFKAILTIKNP